MKKIIYAAAIVLGLNAACAAETALESLQAAQAHSAAAANGSTPEGLSTGASSSFHGKGQSSEIQLFLPGYSYEPASRENLIFTAPAPRAAKPPVPALSSMGDSQLRKVRYSREIGGFTLGNAAGYAGTALTGSAIGACIGWFLVGGMAATLGLGLIGLAVGAGLAAIFIGLLKGTPAASPRRDGYDQKVSF